MRIVIDTSVWVSGLLWQSDAWHLLNLAERGKVEICIAYPMLLELEEVLAYPRLQPRLRTLQQTPAQLTAYALSLATPFDVSRTGPHLVAADHDDDLFLLCAMQAQATFVVTADQHLLAMKSHQDIDIVTINDFLDREFGG